MNMDEPFRANDPRLARLWGAVRPHETDAHEVEPVDVGQYVALRNRQGQPAAAAVFPEVARHLADGCAACEAVVADVDPIVAEAILEEQLQAARPQDHILGWLRTFVRALYVPRLGYASGPGSTATADAADSAERGPLVETLTLTVEGYPGVVVELSPHGDGIEVRVRSAGDGPEARSDAASPRAADDLAGWTIRLTTSEPGDASAEPIAVSTNEYGAGLLRGASWEGVLDQRVEVLPPPTA
jgi:hypothetical protein